MDNISYNRLALLFERLGISAENGSEDKAELMAYCTGIDIVRKGFENNFNQLFADTAEGLGLSLFCDLLKIDSTLGDDEKRDLLVQSFGQSYGDYAYGDFERELDKQCPMLSAAPLDFYITINGSVKNDYEQLSRLGKLFENYLPACTVIAFCGDGFSFDYWDSTPYLFEDYDNFNLNFEFLDELM